MADQLLQTPITDEQAADVIYRAVADNEVRLAHGRMLRQLMLEKIEAGEKPEGYRADWIRSTSRRLIAELGRASTEFNEMYVDDRISAEDFVDVVATVRSLLEKVAKS